MTKKKEKTPKGGGMGPLLIFIYKGSKSNIAMNSCLTLPTTTKIKQKFKKPNKGSTSPSHLLIVVCKMIKK